MIEFKATIQSMGDSNHLHHFHAWEIEKVFGEHKNMDVHSSNLGRYKIKPHDSVVIDPPALPQTAN